MAKKYKITLNTASLEPRLGKDKIDNSMELRPLQLRKLRAQLVVFTQNSSNIVATIATVVLRYLPSMAATGTRRRFELTPNFFAHALVESEFLVHLLFALPILLLHQLLFLQQRIQLELQLVFLIHSHSDGAAMVVDAARQLLLEVVTPSHFPTKLRLVGLDRLRLVVR